MATVAAKRGRGRPPKKTTALPVTQDDTDAQLNGHAAQIDSIDAGGETNGLLTKGRGRLPKKGATTSIVQPANGVPEPDDGELGIPVDAGDVAAKKPRTNGETDPDDEPEKSSGKNLGKAPGSKGRGRPKKNPQ